MNHISQDEFDEIIGKRKRGRDQSALSAFKQGFAEGYSGSNEVDRLREKRKRDGGEVKRCEACHRLYPAYLPVCEHCFDEMRATRRPEPKPAVVYQEQQPPAVHHHHYAAIPSQPPPADHSGSSMWQLFGFLFAVGAIPLALLLDISSPNSGGRTIAAMKGFLVAVVLGVLLMLLAS